MTHPKKAASVYIRLSREAQAENLSKEGMIADCKGTAAEHGLDVLAVHIDDGISGAVRNRPAFLRWLADGREGRASTLIAWHADRMTREGVNVAAMILDVVEGKDSTTGKVTLPPVRLLDTKGLDSQADETAFRFRFVIAAEVARGERARMADRSKSATRRAMAAGRWAGGAAPYGFRIVENPNGPGKVLAIEPNEAAFIREAALRVLGGETFVSVLRWANGPHGLPPRRSPHWGRKSLEQILGGHLIAGRVMQRVNGSRTDLEPVLNDQGEPVTVPAIVTADESAALRKCLAPSPDPRKQGGRQPSRVLSGLMSCHSCGQPLWVARPSDAVPVYRCQIGKAKGICTAPVSVRCEIAERYITERWLAAYGDEPSYTRQATMTGAAVVEAAEAAVAVALAKVAKSASPEAVADLVTAQAAREEARGLPQTSEVRLVPTGRTIREDWEAGEVADRRALLAANIAVIVLKPNPGGKGGKGRTFYPERFLVIDKAPATGLEPAESVRSHRIVVRDLAEVAA